MIFSYFFDETPQENVRALQDVHEVVQPVRLGEAVAPQLRPPVGARAVADEVAVVPPLLLVTLAPQHFL